MDTEGKKIIETGDMSGNLSSDIVSMDNMLHLAMNCVWGAGATGTLYFECSAKQGSPTVDADWEELDNVAIAGSAGTQLWLDKNAPYRWARIRWSFGAGAGTLDVNFISKGDL